MGQFGYICKGCGTAIRGNEVCLLKHIRHNKVLGEAIGHYNKYGGVIEQEGQKNAFRGKNDTDANSHREICESEFDMDDSCENKTLRIYKDEEVDACLYRMIRIKEFLEESIKKSAEEVAEMLKHVRTKQFADSQQAEFDKLPFVSRSETWSGVVAWHKKCYNKASIENQNDPIPSERDPNQSCGKAREEFNSCQREFPHPLRWGMNRGATYI